jgi:uncharacterized protein (TIGR03435 family)
MTERIAWAILLVATASWGQAFEVASVRPNRLDDRIVTIHVGPGGSFTARGYTLVLLIQRAYGVMDWNVDGGPDWIRVDRFDVAAKANVAGDLTESQLRPMLAKLLEERFQLKLHRTSKPMAGYALQVARGGPRLKRSTAEEQRDSFRLTASRLSGQAISMRDFARFVGGKLGLIAVDETGLSGLYDFDVEWRPPAGFLPDVDPREAQRSTVLDAIQKQLGLKFVAKKVAVEVLIIDHAERPSEN